jgi:hypothetical protein
VTAQAAPRRLRVLSPATVPGALGLVLIAAWVPLVYLTGDLQASRDGAAAAFAMVCGFLGMLLARRQPRNPEGWLLLGLSVGVIVVVDTGLYAVLDYRMHHGRMPLGEAALFVHDTLGTPLILVAALVILLFPDGQLTRRWTRVLWMYVALVAVATTGVVANEAGSIAGQPIHVDLSGSYSGTGGPSGGLGVLAAASLGLFAVPLFWPAFVARQALSWRRAAGDRRQQLKWLLTGAVCLLIGLLLIILGPPKTELSGRIIRDLAFLLLAALPASIGVGILRYHLYDIDRLISRTLSYTLVTGLLVGVYAGIVTLATRVLPLTSPIGVAASTLAVAALFNPLRRRVQRAVDRRFNRARYDAEATVVAFAGNLKDAVDLDSVLDQLASAVHTALEPARVSVWISPGD